MFAFRSVDDPAHPAHTNHVISTQGKRAERIWFPDTPLFESTGSELMEICNDSKNECCGFIDDDQNVWLIPNVHEEPSHNFYMEEKGVTRVLEHIYNVMDSTIIGIFHTHPNNVPWPSPRDIRGWPDPKLKWRYFVVTNSEVYEWGLV